MFSNCNSLTGVVIPDGVTSIGFGAFCGCTRLSSVTNIGNWVFDATNSLYSVDERDHGDVVHGSDKLAFHVEESNIAEPYAKENDIPYVLTPAPTTKTAEDLLIMQIAIFFTMKREEIIEKLGPDFEVVPAGPEGVCGGYLYEGFGDADCLLSR